jgi:hypothetical protein
VSGIHGKDDLVADPNQDYVPSDEDDLGLITWLGSPTLGLSKEYAWELTASLSLSRSVTWILGTFSAIALVVRDINP